MLTTWLTYVHTNRASVAEAFSTTPFLQHTRTNNRNEGEHFAVKYHFAFSNMTKLVAMIRAERRRITLRYLERKNEAERKMRTTSFTALKQNTNKEAPLLTKLNDYAQGKVTAGRKDSLNYTSSLIKGRPEDGIRILVEWDPMAREKPTLTKKLPITISPKLKPRIITLVVDSKGRVLLVCECREWLNTHILCPHHQCVNAQNVSIRDVHPRYWKR